MKIKTLTEGQVIIEVLYACVVWLAVLHGNAAIKSMLEIYFTVLTVLLGLCFLFVSRKEVVAKGDLISSNRFHFGLLMELVKAIAIAYMGFDVLASIYFILCLFALGKKLEDGTQR